LTINKDKDKNDPNSKPLVLAKADGKFPTGQWQTLLIEFQGDKVAVLADNGVRAEASHPSLKVEKTGYRFVTRGSSLLLDDLTIWNVAPRIWTGRETSSAERWVSNSVLSSVYRGTLN